MSINLMSAIFRTEFRDLQDGDGNTTKASTAKFVCIALADHANDEGEGAYPSLSKMAYKTSLSRTTIINALDALKYNGILTANGTSKWDTVNYTVNPVCFSQDSQPALLVKPLDPHNQPALPPPGKPVDPNRPSTIQESSLQTDEIKGKYNTEPNAMDKILSMGNPLQDREKLAINAFESAFGINRPWTWYPPRTSDERTWKDFRAYILELFEADHDCFTKYVTWTRVPYAKGTMTALGIKRNPQDFPDSWTCYLNYTSMSKKPATLQNVRTL